MNMERLAQVNEQKLSDPNMNPVVSKMVRKFIAEMAARDVAIEVCQAFRSYADQAVLYAKGRTTPGPRVTDCQAGHSWHNFGLAVDVCPLDMNGNPDWNNQHPVWSLLTEVALELGFTVGARWRLHPDWPHLEWTGKFPPEVPPLARLTLQDQNPGDPNAGLAGVWRDAGLVDA